VREREEEKETEQRTMASGAEDDAMSMSLCEEGENHSAVLLWHEG